MVYSRGVLCDLYVTGEVGVRIYVVGIYYILILSSLEASDSLTNIELGAVTAGEFVYS